MDEQTVAQRLQAALARGAGGEPEVTALTLLTGGSAAQTWRFHLRGVPGVEESGADYILRLAHGGDQFEMGIDKTQEAAVQSLAAAHGVLAPRIILTLEPGDQLGQGFVMEMIQGETIPQRILRQEQYARARAQMAQQCGTLLAAIHRVPTATLADQLPDLSASPQLASLKDLYDSFDTPLPVFDYTFRWLERHLPASGGRALVHGDFRNGNLIVDGTGIVAILDWELAHLGDPMEDLGWLCVNSWRFGNRSQPVGGFGTREQLYAGYRAAGGEVDEAAVYFWELLGTLKWGLICLYQADVYLRGEDRSVNRAAIGRRVSEVEIDLLALLDHSR